jgi:hypothetical protein
MKALLSALVVLAGCGGPPPIYTTTCGMEYLGTFQGGKQVSSEQMDRAEAIAVKALAKSTDKRLARTCAAAKGYALYTMPTRWWIDPTYGGIGGITYAAAIDTGGGSVTVGSDDGYVLPWMLAHELAHVAQGGHPDAKVGPGDDEMHAGWTAAGIYAAIDSTKEGQ